MLKSSIKSRIFITFALFALMSALVYSAIGLIIAYAAEDGVITQVLHHESEYLRAQHLQGKTPHPRLDNMYFFTSSDTTPEPFIDLLARKSLDGEVRGEDGNYWHIAEVNLEPGQTSYLFAQVGPWLAVSSLSGEFFTLIAFLLASSLLIAVAMTYWLSHRTVSHLIDLANAVQAHNSGPKTFPQSSLQDEVGLLSRTLESSFAKLHSALQREADFTRDIGHELRTPLAIVGNFFKLYQSRSLSNEEMQEVSRQVEQINTSVSVLMALAKAESVELRPLYLRQLVEQCLLSLATLNKADNFAFEVDISDSLQIVGNPELLTLLINNLVTNAFNYAETPQLSIHANQQEMVFANRAQSVPDDMLSKQVSHPQSQGIGQGLYLVKRIADTLGWQCSTDFDGELLFIRFHYQAVVLSPSINISSRHYFVPDESL